MKIFKLLLTALVLLAIIRALSGCSEKIYVDDVSCKELYESALGSLWSGKDYQEMTDAHREFYFANNGLYDDYFLVCSSEVNDIDELFIFHASNEESANALFEICRDYVRDVSENSRAFIESYAPAEIQKLDAADVKKYGNYVVLAIMSSTDVTAVTSAIEGELRGE